jgi:hypothetical protein
MEEDCCGTVPCLYTCSLMVIEAAVTTLLKAVAGWNVLSRTNCMNFPYPNPRIIQRDIKPPLPELLEYFQEEISFRGSSFVSRVFRI